MRLTDKVKQPLNVITICINNKNLNQLCSETPTKCDQGIKRNCVHIKNSALMLSYGLMNVIKNMLPQSDYILPATHLN